MTAETEAVESPFAEAARASYDKIAHDYTARYADWSTGLPLERALLSAFAELVRSAGSGGTAPVADVGSGPGGLTARLHELGLPVFGVDVSPRMVALAREAHPHLRFHVGSMTSLDLPSASLSGLTALYSTIHVPDEALPSAFAEFHRVLLPGAPLLLAFQTSGTPPRTDHLHLAECFGHEIALDYWFRPVEKVAGLLEEAGLRVWARAEREPEGEETRGRGFVVARRPG
ncbi:class I SAM-dependent methyltransferase [Streptomyces thermocoprophilus]|uniref:Class I SAM-dependent methyltransferase n=1 Tax=Streptomyces thermocoprophilus TaxID=78356 RepID=A0ABV5VAM5_9ACTN